MNLVEAKEGEAVGEQEGEEVDNDANPYAFDPNNVQKDEENMPLGRSLVIYRLLRSEERRVGKECW